jgi:hypothetical protein
VKGYNPFRLFGLVFSTLLLPLLTIALLARRTRRPALGWATSFLLALGVTGFSVLAAPWGFLGLAVRNGLVVLFVLAVAVSLRKGTDEPRPEAFFRAAMKVLIGLFFGAVAMSAIGAHDAPDETIDVRFPLRGERYLVMHGGTTSATNYHVAHPSQRYALDIVKVNALGRRATGMMPKELDGYFIWNAEVVAPCDGTVVAAVDGLADNIPPARDEKNLAGNHVAIRCQGVTIYLAHLRRGSVRVKPGVHIEQGTVLGNAGNSGNTTEPHLHVHAERGGGGLSTTPGIALTFDGKWFVRNDLVP